MSGFFYSRMAVQNIKKNSKSYIPYILTCIGTIMMFYVMTFLAFSEDVKNNMGGGTELQIILMFGMVIIGLFSAIFLFYTSSFLMKQRKMELGMFNILGMEKRHIIRVIFLETLLVAFISLVLGLALGLAFSKLMMLLLFKLLSFPVAMGFSISVPGIILTVIVFLVIFFLTLLNSYRQIKLANPIELLHGGQVGEREPKTKWILTLVGLLTLGGGYAIALFTKSPLEALNLFFVAVVLVIIGTYCLFTAGSIALLKLLRKNKKFYYQTKHFTGISGMIYRMKQNAIGLSNICILSTAVLVVISSTVSLYAGLEDSLRVRFPRNIEVYADGGASLAQVEQFEGIMDRLRSEKDISMKNVVQYRSASVPTILSGNHFDPENQFSYYKGLCVVYLITQDEYQRIGYENPSLSEDEILLYSLRGEVVLDKLTIGDRSFHVKENLKEFHAAGELGAHLAEVCYFVVPDEATIEDIYRMSYPDEETYPFRLAYYFGFDTDLSTEDQIALTREISEETNAAGLPLYAAGAESLRYSFLSIYGGLFFIGLFLGVLFTMATVLIIYYKQISEGYDDAKRFEIMKKVGMSQQEIRATIRSQVLVVFFLPLLMAAIHIAVAFPVIKKLLGLFNMTNGPLFLLCTVATLVIFAVVYAVVYGLTAKAYYKIVK